MISCSLLVCVQVPLIWSLICVLLFFGGIFFKFTRIDRVESQITEKLTDLLATAKTGDEKFRVFSKFNALFFRHRIRGAIQQHQAELISTVKEDIQELQNMFKKSYTRSEAEKMSMVRDLPPMSGKIIWAKQIERQLTMYIERIEAVLGKDWERHSEGRSLKAICDR